MIQRNEDTVKVQFILSYPKIKRNLSIFWKVHFLPVQYGFETARRDNSFACFLEDVLYDRYIYCLLLYSFLFQMGQGKLV